MDWRAEALALDAHNHGIAKAAAAGAGGIYGVCWQSSTKGLVARQSKLGCLVGGGHHASLVISFVLRSQFQLIDYASVLCKLGLEDGNIRSVAGGRLCDTGLKTTSDALRTENSGFVS